MEKSTEGATIGVHRSGTITSVLGDEQFVRQHEVNPLEINNRPHLAMAVASRAEYLPTISLSENLDHDDPPPPYEFESSHTLPQGSSPLRVIRASTNHQIPRRPVSRNQTAPSTTISRSHSAWNSRLTRPRYSPQCTYSAVRSSSDSCLIPTSILSTPSSSPQTTFTSTGSSCSNLGSSLPPSYGFQRAVAASSKAAEAGYELQYEYNSSSDSALSHPLRERSSSSGSEASGQDSQPIIAYLVPFPRPRLRKCNVDKVPERFLVYTPPPPLSKDSLVRPGPDCLQTLQQQKCKDEIWGAPANDSKTASWSKVKAVSFRGLGKVVSRTTKTSQSEFASSRAGSSCTSLDACPSANSEPREMVFIYPSTVRMTTEEVRSSFIHSMLRTQTDAEKEEIIASGLMPIGTAADVSQMAIWPLGGLTELDKLWRFSTLRSSEARRGLANRLYYDSKSGQHQTEMVKVSLRRSDRLHVMEEYLGSVCFQQEQTMFRHPGLMIPDEGAVVDAMDRELAPESLSASPESRKDCWEYREIRLDVKEIFQRAAKEWIRWSKGYEANPEKASSMRRR